MQGYPKHLNSRADYDYVQQHFPERYEEELEALKTTAYMWVPTGQVLASEEAGVRDATHRVEAMGEDGGFMQYELVLNPAGKFFELGFGAELLANGPQVA